MLNVIVLSVSIYLLVCWILLCWVSLYWVSLCWVSLCWVSLCWVSLGWMSLCWVSWRRTNLVSKKLPWTNTLAYSAAASATEKRTYYRRHQICSGVVKNSRSAVQLLFPPYTPENEDQVNKKCGTRLALVPTSLDRPLSLLKNILYLVTKWATLMIVFISFFILPLYPFLINIMVKWKCLPYTITT